MNILLLGAGGFIGVNLLRRLVDDGVHEVTTVDIDDSRYHEAGLAHASTVRRLDLDIRHDGPALEREVASANVVVDLVAHANPSLYVDDPLGTFQLNFLENLKVAEMCVRHRRRLVQFSTCEVYGVTPATVIGADPAEMPCTFNEDESYLIMGPVNRHRWIYACAKQLLERVLHAYGLQGQLDWTVIRPFNLIGPYIDYLPSETPGNPRVFSHFMNALLYGTPMKLVDGGHSYRAYTHIDDAVECIVRILENPNGVCSGQIFNVGNPDNELSIRELAHLMREIHDESFRVPGDPHPEVIDVSSEAFYGPGYQDCDRRIADISKARNLLGWEPRYGIREVIERTMAHFVERHRSGSRRRQAF